MNIFAGVSGSLGMFLMVVGAAASMADGWGKLGERTARVGMVFMVLSVPLVALSWLIPLDLYMGFFGFFLACLLLLVFLSLVDYRRKKGWL